MSITGNVAAMQRFLISGDVHVVINSFSQCFLLFSALFHSSFSTLNRIGFGDVFFQCIPHIYLY